MVNEIVEHIKSLLDEFKVRPIILHLKIDDVTYYLVIW
jgi:hypothetical protein